MKLMSMEEFAQDGIENKVKDMKNPNCNSCNECCSMGTILLPREYGYLKQYMKNTKEGKKIYNDAVSRIMKHTTANTVYFMCPFSTSNKRCSIYYIRPTICREFHCSSELAIGFNKANYENEENLLIYDLFYKR